MLLHRPDTTIYFVVLAVSAVIVLSMKLFESIVKDKVAELLLAADGSMNIKTVRPELNLDQPTLVTKLRSELVKYRALYTVILGILAIIAPVAAYSSVMISFIRKSTLLSLREDMKLVNTYAPYVTIVLVAGFLIFMFVAWRKNSLPIKVIDQYVAQNNYDLPFVNIIRSGALSVDMLSVQKIIRKYKLVEVPDETATPDAADAQEMPINPYTADAQGIPTNPYGANAQDMPVNPGVAEVPYPEGPNSQPQNYQN
ncbi:hypothetical protein BSR28_06365 [Boudabousia liubingyangii]|nr:hypothetical protein BSR28_06365 [Boudabousia liubingyangii]